jgi:hypothetical protein
MAQKSGTLVSQQSSWIELDMSLINPCSHGWQDMTHAQILAAIGENQPKAHPPKKSSLPANVVPTSREGAKGMPCLAR